MAMWSSPHEMFARSMSTLEDESGSTPSVLGEFAGALMLMSWICTLVEYTGCTVHNPEFLSVTPHTYIDEVRYSSC
eukprot:m.181134 g.181134  ORF g.181134 m.181134 type:complete len:76 (+) comp18441_c0_seq15:2890-3117(+)